MQRRDILRLLATGAVLQLAPTKLFAVLQEARSLVQAHTSPQILNPHQYDTVKVMAEMIIPRTDTPGATDVGTVDFIDLVLSEWYDEPERGRFLDGLGDVDSRAKNLFGKDFIDCAPAQQQNILAVLGEQDDGRLEGVLIFRTIAVSSRIFPQFQFLSHVPPIDFDGLFHLRGRSDGRTALRNDSGRIPRLPRTCSCRAQPCRTCSTETRNRGGP